MQAAVYTGAQQPFALKEYPLLAPEAGMASVMLESSGLCGTDVHIWEGALAFAGPLIIGHEFLGRVHALGSESALDALGRALAVGDRVVVNVIAPCGSCALCTSGGAASCLHLGESLIYAQAPEEAPDLHGGFAEATVVPTHYLVKIPDSLPLDVTAALLCAGPTVIRGMIFAGGIAAGVPVVVQGSGPVGLFAVLYAKTLGAGPVILIGSGSHPLRLELARALGADATLDIHTTTVEERRSRILALTGGQGVELIIEGAGAPSAIPEGLPLLRPRGRYVLAGQYSDRGAIAIPTHLITLNALQLIGSAQFTAQDRADYLTFLQQVPDKWDTIRRIITDRLPLSQINEAFRRAREGSSVKVVFVNAEAIAY